MDFWQRAKNFAEEATKRSQQLTQETISRSQHLTIGSSKISDLVSEATKKADQIKIEAFKRADQFKSLAEGYSPSLESNPSPSPSPEELQEFGVTDDLREFVTGITISTFKDFPIEQDEPEMADVATVSNVRQDLTEWQERHATLVLSTAKEISRLRYQLCPRFMKERKFWRIYFVLVNTHVAPYEKRYMEHIQLKSIEKAIEGKEKDNPPVGTTSRSEAIEPNRQIKTSTSSAEQDLDIFLLGDLGSDDEGSGDNAAGGFDDDFDKISENGDDGDDGHGKQSMKTTAL
ncbi:hypothetical protein GIB67_038640 [Kingdonia uniflora]|uniref:BSD domain-containing protein n=1 Tax=Kingdonia uniflora TaxID=39325 RepID=A0A7J7NPV9_9MAGN|nr:hypothetical protein GIB67_038640 [Kingdonia uniflora]